MKKHFFLPLLFICLIVVSCAPKESKQPKPYNETQSSVEAAIEQNIRQYGDSEQSPKALSSSQIIDEGARPYESASGTDRSESSEIDVDLTALSSSMVYAETYNIMMDPASYVGKTIKGSGEYNAFYYEIMDRHFHYFIISDATGCCPQGLDFVLNGGRKYPDDYPNIGENIEVTGVFVKGEIDGQAYYHLAVDDITVLKE